MDEYKRETLKWLMALAFAVGAIPFIGMLAISAASNHGFSGYELVVLALPFLIVGTLAASRARDCYGMVVAK